MEAQSRYSRVYQSLLNMGYLKYHNYKGLSEAILQECPWNSLDQTFLDKQFRIQVARSERPTLTYVKPPITPDSVLYTHEALKSSIFGGALIIDDPIEFPSQSLEWYAERFLTSDAVVIHLLSSDYVNNQHHNLKASLISGLAIGFGKPTIMLARAPYQPPADYREWLEVHETAESCVKQINKWICQISDDLPYRRPRRQSTQDRALRQLDIRDLFLGDVVAELESDNLHEYFVETASYFRAIDNQSTILLGRRGTGKTAILYSIASQFSNKADSHVAVLKPVGYETHGLIRVLKEIRERAERGFLIESLWKFLIYSEIATSLKRGILQRPAHLDRTSDESTYLNYYENNLRILSPPFSERLDQALSSLEGIGGITDASKMRQRISEELHDQVIARLRYFLGTVLSGRQKLIVLIDGLDGPWAPGDHIDQLAELIGGLLEVIQHVPRDFGRSSSNLKQVDARIVVLLRSDIFASIKHSLPEQDKLPIERVVWSDPHLLLRVLELRMLYGAPRNRTSSEIWSTLFPESLNGMSCSEFMLNSILPRPRDLIHLAKLAVRNAINRGNARVMPDDLLTAQSQYSQHAFESILYEDDPSKGKLEEILFQFVGHTSTFNRTEIESLFDSAGVKAKDVESYLNLLCDINFLSVEAVNGFQFAQHEEDRIRLRSFASSIASRQERSEEYKISPAFHPVLGIE